MFKGYEFTFNGESSLMYGLMIYDFDGRGQDDVPFGNQGSIIETRTNNRIQPIHFGVNYTGSPLEFKLVFGSDRELDRYEMEDIAFWLTGHQQYCWLTIGQPDLDGISYKCIITNLTPITDGWLPYAFEAKVVCDCSYAYGLPFEQQLKVNGPTECLFRNESSVHEYLKPVLTYQPLSRDSSISIVNHSDGDREFLIENLPSSGATIVIDNTNGVIQDTTYGTNLYKGFNLNFFRLVHGDNNLTVTGDGMLTISGRFLRNVSA